MNKKKYYTKNKKLTIIENYPKNRTKKINDAYIKNKKKEGYKTNRCLFRNKLQMNRCLLSAFYIIIFCSSFCLNKQNSNLSNLYFDSEITLTIKGKGVQPILNNKIIPIPSEVKLNNLSSQILVNGIDQSIIDFDAYNLISETILLK